MWEDLHLSSWISDPSGPLHDVPPFDEFDLRVMMLVGESRAWAEAVSQRCRVFSTRSRPARSRSTDRVRSSTRC